MALISIVHFIIFYFKGDLRNKYSFVFILCFYETRAEEMRTLNLGTVQGHPERVLKVKRPFSVILGAKKMGLGMTK